MCRQLGGCGDTRLQWVGGIGEGGEVRWEKHLNPGAVGCSSSLRTLWQGAHSSFPPAGAGCVPLPPSLAAVAISLPPRAQPSVCSVSTDGCIPRGGA